MTPAPIASALAAAEELYGALHVTPAQLDAWLGARKDARLGADAVLACGLCLSLPEAVAVFERRLLPAARRALSSAGGTPASHDEVLQRVRGRLLVTEAGRSPRISAYSGAGSLQGFVNTVAARLLADLMTRRPDEPPDGEAFEAVADSKSFEHDLLKAEQRELFQRAFSAALAALPAQDRTLLRQNLVDGVSLDKLVELYGSSRATLSRRLIDLRAQLAADTRARLGEGLQDADDVEPLLRSLQSQADVSLFRLLREADPEP